MKSDISIVSILDELSPLATELAGRQIRADEGLMGSGLTSADLVVLLDQAATQWGVALPVEVLFDRGDLIGLAGHIARALGALDPRDGSAPAPLGTTPADGDGDGDGDGDRAADSRRALRGRIRQLVGHGDA